MTSIAVQHSFHSANETMLAEAKSRASDLESNNATPYSILSPAGSVASPDGSLPDPGIIVNGK